MKKECVEDFICGNCDPVKFNKAMDKVANDFYDKVKELIKEEVGMRGPKHKSGLHFTDIHTAVTDALVRNAVDEQMFGRQVDFDSKKVDDEMVESMEDQYKYYVAKFREFKNKEEDSFYSEPDRALHKSEVN